MNCQKILKSKIKTIRYMLEAAIVRLGLLIFTNMPPQSASGLGAAIARFVGKRISVHNLAYKNLSKAMPELTKKEKEKILDDMWDNLGRIVGEYGHIAKFSADQIGNFIEISQEVEDRLKLLKKSTAGGIIFGAHIGNWEIGPKAFLKYGLKVSILYRPLNNPYVEKLTSAMRGVDLIGKSTGSNRKIVQIIKNGGFVVILADQRSSRGEAVKFFHDEAVTSTAIARIALKYNVPLIPARAIRSGKNFRLRLEVEKPLAIQKTNDLNSDSINLTRQINLKLEEWILEYPAQWFWVHNRWKR
jgi:KDO2-lipid IV(A) lauroyltransferase